MHWNKVKLNKLKVVKLFFQSIIEKLDNYLLGKLDIKNLIEWVCGKFNISVLELIYNLSQPVATTSNDFIKPDIVTI